MRSVEKVLRRTLRTIFNRLTGTDKSVYKQIQKLAKRGESLPPGYGNPSEATRDAMERAGVIFEEGDSPSPGDQQGR